MSEHDEAYHPVLFTSIAPVISGKHGRHWSPDSARSSTINPLQAMREGFECNFFLLGLKVQPNRPSTEQA
jgi:hypothetical protein